jgi:hypothetical protein
MPSGKF